MTGRLIVDLAEDGTVTVGTLAGDGELPRQQGVRRCRGRWTVRRWRICAGTWRIT